MTGSRGLDYENTAVSTQYANRFIDDLYNKQTIAWIAFLGSDYRAPRTAYIVVCRTRIAICRLEGWKKV